MARPDRQALETASRGTPRSRDVAVAVIYVSAYVGLDWISYIHPVAQLAITPWNPPPGLTLFLLVRFGLRYIPAVFVASLMAEVLVRGMGSQFAASLGGAALVAAGYSAVGAILARALRPSTSLRNLHDVNVLVLAAGIGPALIGLVYVGVNVAAGSLHTEEMTGALLQFWIGDAIGIVVTAPILLEFAEDRTGWWSGLGPETIGQASAVAVALWIVFGLAATDEFKFFYLLFLPLIWIALRRGIRGAVVASLAMQLGLVAAGGNLAAKGIMLWELQFLMLALALTALYLGMAVTVGKRAQRAFNEREAALNRALRKATAGALAAGIAHELNQPLTAIGTYVDSCMAMTAREQPNPVLRETLAKTMREVDRAAEVIRRLRTLFRIGAARREQVLPGALVATVVESVAARAAKHRIAIRVSQAADLPAINVDPVQMQMVIRNVLTNAIDSLIGSDQPNALIQIDLRPVAAQDAVLCEVSDNGPGISPDLGDRLFEPFVTTKAEGMGLGLAISRSIAEANQSTLTLVETRGAGATFQLVLPSVRDRDSS